MTALSSLLGGNRAFGMNYLAGLQISHAADTDHDLTVAVGECRDETNTYDLHLAAAMTKRVDAAWAVGSGSGGLDTGSVALAWYHVFLIMKDSDGSIDVLFSTQPITPTMPAGYTYRRRIGSRRTNASANWVQTVQYGDKVIYLTPIEDVVALAFGPGSALLTISSPAGIVCEAIFNIYVNFTAPGPASPAQYAITFNACTPGAVTGTISIIQMYTYPIVTGVTVGFGGGKSRVSTNTSSQVYFTSNLLFSAWCTTLGYYDRRSR